MSFKKSKITGKIYNYNNKEIIMDDTNQVYKDFIVWLKDNSLPFFDGTTEEINQEGQKQKLEFAENFRQLRKQVAKDFSDNFANRITVELIGKPSSEVNEIDTQLVDTAHKILDRLNSRNADFWTARREINAMMLPTNAIALSYFNELKTFVNDFVANNYPIDKL